jgi:hypothetical protein
MTKTPRNKPFHIRERRTGLRQSVRQGNETGMLMSKWVFVGLSAVALTAEVALADEGTLTGPALRQVVAGKTLVLATPMGQVPIQFSANGSLSAYAPDLKSYLGTDRDRGTWWVNNNRLCQKWEKWLDGRLHCFTVRASGTTVHWTRDDGLNGTARISH